MMPMVTRNEGVGVWECEGDHIDVRTTIHVSTGKVVHGLVANTGNRIGRFLVDGVLRYVP